MVEFVHPDDPMARRLLANKPDGLFPDYRRDAFEALLAGAAGRSCAAPSCRPAPARSTRW